METIDDPACLDLHAAPKAQRLALQGLCDPDGGRGRGRADLNVSSQAGKRGFPFLGPYCAAKAGVILMTQTMALELGSAGIAVNAVCPGTVDTDLMNKDSMFENLMGGPEGLAAYIAREIPLGRLQARRRSPVPSAGCSPSRRPGSPGRR